MADYTPMTGYGTQLFYGSASGTVTTELTNLKSIDCPMDEYATIDRSTLASTRRASILGLPDGGEVVVTYQYAMTQFNALNALNGTEKWWKIGAPDTSGDILFQGYMTKHSVSFSEGDEIQEATFTIKVNTAKTITVGS